MYQYSCYACSIVYICKYCVCPHGPYGLLDVGIKVSIYLSIYLYITILILFITSTFCPVFCILIQERCYSLGGYLVEIMSAEEHDVLLPLWQSACKLSDVFTWNNFLKQHISIILFSYSNALYRLIFQVASIHQPYPCNVFYLHF